jgi:hypothetical protein
VVVKVVQDVQDGVAQAVQVVQTVLCSFSEHLLFSLNWGSQGSHPIRQPFL